MVDSTVSSNHSRSGSNHTQILLATALVNVPDSTGTYHSVRALLDSGSQATFITEICVQRLGLRRQKASVSVGGLGTAEVGTCKSTVQLHVRSMHNSYQCQVLALVLPQVTGVMPLQPVDQSGLATTIQRHQLNLADPDYHRPGHIDVLLGADIYFDLLLSGRVKDTEGSTVFQNTNLGWIISGAVPTKYSHLMVKAHTAVGDLDLQLRAFWEMEGDTAKRQLTVREQNCEDHFKKTYTRNEYGRFVVRLPFHDNLDKLGDTSLIATRRLFQIEKRLEIKSAYKEDYHAFMSEYLSLNHMEEVHENHDSTVKCSYLPHHFVLKESSSTTKLRVVFDGSVQPSCGLSLNETLLVGPVIQEELLDIILRFRMHNIVFVADIEKMYRQILVHRDDRDYQRIKWRTSSSLAIRDYRLTTVTYGTAAAPFLATRCLLELATIGKFSHPLASVVVKRDFYVDDLMSGADTVQAAQEIQKQLIDLLSSAGLQLRKWASNNLCLIENLEGHITSQQSAMDLMQGTIKTLGIQWHPTTDQFSFKVSIDCPDIITKRGVLSQISRLFDPLGWLSPVIVRAKIVIQRLWLAGVGWDEQLPPDLSSEWKQFSSELGVLEQLVIPRQSISDSSQKDFQLHGFCDASEAAFGAVIYIYSQNNGQPTVRLLCSKTRVAPLKRVSLPRLELCGAVILARLMGRLQATLSVRSENIYMWTDSTIVLAWLRRPPFYWKTFVANRITEIQELVSPDHWRHVSTTDNPADCLSRGLSPKQLLNSVLWWAGPTWLKDSCWPSVSEPPSDHSDAETERRRPKVMVHIASTEELLPLKNYSSLNRLVRVTSFCMRFIANCRSKIGRTSGFLTTQELRDSLWYWIAQAQSEKFKEELRDCRNSQLVNGKSALRSLHPFIDTNGLLRVGGRLQQSLLSYDQKHPIILPSHHALTTLIIRHEHISSLHAGSQLLQTILGRRFWIIGVRRAIRHLVHQCMKCFRLKVTGSQQLMGELPQWRIKPSRAFSHCGVDYAGPLLIKSANGRGNRKMHKAYICIFICFASRAVHIELVNDLSTASFIAALRRFIARRGKPSAIHSDCGTNFVGAKRHLKELYTLTSSSDHNQQISTTLSQNDINWYFNPPSAPHFGGLWEAGVRSIKYHHRIVGSVSLTYEEMYTTLTQIESCLNSRPLSAISRDPDDLGPLTPGHFLIGDAMSAAPDRDVTDLKLNRLSRWELVQRLYQHFWKRWSSEYLSRLQQRPKWVTPTTNIAVGDLVLLKEGGFSPLHWPMARVTQTHPGPDGLVRVVTLKTANGSLKRPISKCCVLPITEP